MVSRKEKKRAFCLVDVLERASLWSTGHVKTSGSSKLKCKHVEAGRCAPGLEPPHHFIHFPSAQ